MCCDGARILLLPFQTSESKVFKVQSGRLGRERSRLCNEKILTRTPHLLYKPTTHALPHGAKPTTACAAAARCTAFGWGSDVGNHIALPSQPHGSKASHMMPHRLKVAPTVSTCSGTETPASPQPHRQFSLFRAHIAEVGRSEGPCLGSEMRWLGSEVSGFLADGESCSLATSWRWAICI
jgi:hypothetical protein